MVKIECIVRYNDLELNKIVEIGEQLEVTKERAEYLVNDRKLAKVIEVIPELKKPVAKKTSKKNK